MHFIGKKFSSKQIEKQPDRFWTELFGEYLRQDQPKIKFLRQLGINPNNVLVKEKTKDWASELARANYKLFCAGKMVKLGPRREVSQILELVKAWKNDISVKHYKTAQLALIHAELMLTDALKLDKDGQPIESTISPKDLRIVTSVIADVQKIQRMALGLPGETTGVITADITGNPQPDAVFNVRVNKDGKFIDPRPKQEPDYEDLAAMDMDTISGEVSG